MKKVFNKNIIFLILLVLLIVSSYYVSAQNPEVIPTPAPESGQTNGEVIFGRLADSISKIFEGVSPFSIPNFSRILLGILLWMVLFSVFRAMNLFREEGKTLYFWSAAAALIVTVLSFIYLPSELLSAIGLEYGALGATILTVIPFAIAVYFTVWATPNFFIARAIWLVFGLYYGVLVLYTFLSAPAGSLDYFKPDHFLYIAAFIASAILFWFIAPLREVVWKEHVKGVKERIDRNINEFGLGLRAGKKVARVASSANP